MSDSESSNSSNSSRLHDELYSKCSICFDKMFEFCLEVLKTNKKLISRAMINSV